MEEDLKIYEEIVLGFVTVLMIVRVVEDFDEVRILLVHKCLVYYFFGGFGFE
jgi:hypothetical protein